MPDCIEHMDDDIGAIRNANRVLKKGGHVLISVPYGMFFWTKNDDAREHRRRYSKDEFRRKLQSNGFEIVRFRMWGFMFLIPIMAAKIFRFRVPHEGVSESPLNTLLYYYMCLENLIPFPIGSAIFVKAKKVREL